MGNVNIEEITSKMVAAKVQELNKKFEEEKSTMEGFLGAKIQQNLDLEIRLDDIKEAYRQLENSIPGDGKQLKHKI